MNESIYNELNLHKLQRNNDLSLRRGNRPHCTFIKVKE